MTQEEIIVKLKQYFSSKKEVSLSVNFINGETIIATNIEFLTDGLVMMKCEDKVSRVFKLDEIEKILEE